MTLPARTVGGLHDAVERLLDVQEGGQGRALDLGAGTGAWAARLRARGFQVTAVDRDRAGFRLRGVRCLERNLDEDFADGISGPFDLITAIEVIEHLENPTHFLRESSRLLASRGRLVLTTPNIESVPGRVRFLLWGELRMFGRDPHFNDPSHISPIHSLMFERMVAAAGLVIFQHAFNGPPTTTRPLAKLASRVLAPFLRGPKGGDCHLYVVGRGPGSEGAGKLRA